MYSIILGIRSLELIVFDNGNFIPFSYPLPIHTPPHQPFSTLSKARLFFCYTMHD